MKIDIAHDSRELGRRAAAYGSNLIREAISARGYANVILATGASQFETLGSLVESPGIDWRLVRCFHLDEYVGLPITHPASFRRYLKERFCDRLPTGPASFHYLNAEGDAAAECRRVGAILREHPIDVAFIGIGENGHLAFNDPPADFHTEEPYLVVELDEACRRQQLGEGWFPTFDDVPKRAISMSIRALLKSAAIVCSVPDTRKAHAVAEAIEGRLTPELPASILRLHRHTALYLDEAAASRLSLRVS